MTRLTGPNPSERNHKLTYNRLISIPFSYANREFESFL